MALWIPNNEGRTARRNLAPTFEVSKSLTTTKLLEGTGSYQRVHCLVLRYLLFNLLWADSHIYSLLVLAHLKGTRLSFMFATPISSAVRSLAEILKSMHLKLLLSLIAEGFNAGKIYWDTNPSPTILSKVLEIDFLLSIRNDQILRSVVPSRPKVWVTTDDGLPTESRANVALNLGIKIQGESNSLD